MRILSAIGPVIAFLLINAACATQMRGHTEKVFPVPPWQQVDASYPKQLCLDTEAMESVIRETIKNENAQPPMPGTIMHLSIGSLPTDEGGALFAACIYSVEGIQGGEDWETHLALFRLTNGSTIKVCDTVIAGKGIGGIEACSFRFGHLRLYAYEQAPTDPRDRPSVPKLRVYDLVGQSLVQEPGSSNW